MHDCYGFESEIVIPVTMQMEALFDVVCAKTERIVGFYEFF